MCAFKARMCTPPSFPHTHTHAPHLLWCLLLAFLPVLFPVLLTLTPPHLQGIIFVYDVTRRETFESLADIWLREVDMYSTVEEAVKMVVANKTDLVRAVHAGPAGGAGVGHI